MKITLQKIIGYFWLILTLSDLSNYVYKTIIAAGSWGLSGTSLFSQPYVKKIYPHWLFGPSFFGDFSYEIYFSTFLSLLSLIVSLFLILNVKYAKILATAFFTIFSLLSGLSINLIYILKYRDDNEITKAYVNQQNIFFLFMILISILIIVLLWIKRTEKTETASITISV